MLDSFSLAVPRVGLEPTWAFAHIILSDARKPIPPPRLGGHDRICTGVHGFADRYLTTRSRGLYIFTLPHF